MSYAVKREIVNRIIAIAAWRRERGEQDQFGFGSDVLARHQRSAAGLDELADYVSSLDDNDVRLHELVRLAFRGDFFDPGATLLTEMGRFRFHDPTTSTDAFVTEMTGYAEVDAAESVEFGGKQVAGDNPWRANFEIRAPVEDTDDDL
ncbi:MAG: hypothetical protein WKF81_13530 [Thermomicrobiales bacterium]